MVTAQFRCRGCHKLHRPSVRGQAYCGNQSCQKKRKNAWRREKYATDLDYRLTARDSTRSWLEGQGGAAEYYRKYRRRRRKDVPASKQSEKKISKEQRESETRSANSDAKTAQPQVITGQYLLVPSGGANSDAIIVELKVITGELLDLQRTTSFP